LVGVVSPANSVIGSTEFDLVGDRTRALADGNVVVSSRSWDNGAANAAGAVTWMNGATGLVGAVDPTNSLVGSTAQDLVGEITLVLPGGEYVVLSPAWDNTAIVDAGAVTVAPAGGVVGPVSTANSLVFDGASFGDSLDSVSGDFTAGNALLIGTTLNRVIVFRPFA
jgi:Repeat of unknown function (DUF5650)